MLFRRSVIVPILRRPFASRVGSLLKAGWSGKGTFPEIVQIPSVHERVTAAPLSSALSASTNPQISSIQNTFSNEPRVTKLDNGLRVVSSQRFSSFSTLGVVIKAGSKYQSKSGVSHAISKLAFHSTQKFPDCQEIVKLMDENSGIFDCQAERNSIIYGVSICEANIDFALELLSETILNPRLLPEEIDNAKNAMLAEVENLNSEPHPNQKIEELLHAVAFGKHSGLGFSKFAEDQNEITAIEKKDIVETFSSRFTPDSMVVCGVGLQHDKLLSLVDKYFGPKFKKSSSSSSSSRTEPIEKYVGGYRAVACDLSSQAAGPNPFPNLAHFAVGFESDGSTQDTYVETCLLKTLLGGGGAFSSGGPGKGMLSRLYTDVLYRHSFMYHCQAHYLPYTEKGLFYVHTSCDPRYLKVSCQAIVDTLRNVVKNPPTGIELERAKKQLKSLMMINLEMTPVVFQDLGEQLLWNDRLVSPQEYSRKIDAITTEKLASVAHSIIQNPSSPPSILGYGDCSNFPKQNFFDFSNSLSSSFQSLKQKLSS